MASTNKTTHYNLSQYVGSDKPTYLVDYNTDMSNIDTGIYDAQAKANLNAAKIGDLEDLTTTTKLDIVDAVNEINSQVGDNTTDIGTLTTDVGNNTTAIGNLIDLDTTDKTDLVSAINEVDGEAGNNTANIGLLSSLTTTEKSNLVGAINEVDSDVNTNTSAIGNLSLLSTADKDSLVDAVNETFDNTPVDISSDFTSTNTLEYLNALYFPAKKMVILTFEVRNVSSSATATLFTTSNYAPAQKYYNVAYGSAGAIVAIDIEENGNVRKLTTSATLVAGMLIYHTA